VNEPARIQSQKAVGLPRRLRPGSRSFTAERYPKGWGPMRQSPGFRPRQRSKQPDEHVYEDRQDEGHR
jgi:hypothetical protein